MLIADYPFPREKKLFPAGLIRIWKGTSLVNLPPPGVRLPSPFLAPSLTKVVEKKLVKNN